MKRVATALVLVLLACAAPTTALGQLGGLPLSVELRGGAAIPTGEITEAAPGVGAETGPYFGIQAAVHVLPALSLYGGYGMSRFGCPRCGERGLDDEVVDDGFGVGVHAALPLPLGGIAPWGEAGGVFHRLVFSGPGGDLSSDRAAGFRVGGGVEIPLGPVRLTPGVHYSAYSAELDLGGLPSETVDVTHFTAAVGLRYRF